MGTGNQRKQCQHRDFRLGGKKVFYNQKLTRQVGLDQNNNPVYAAPDDMMQQLFISVDGEFEDGKTLIYEFNPSLRVADNVAGLQAQLDYAHRVFRYIEAFYNSVRPHSGIGWFGPNVFENLVSSSVDNFKQNIA